MGSDPIVSTLTIISVVEATVAVFRAMAVSDLDARQSGETSAREAPSPQTGKGIDGRLSFSAAILASRRILVECRQSRW